jgi:nitrite reductase/ring-hydroxylating ferredoxin subunit
MAECERLKTMPELNLTPQLLCDSSALRECDGSFTFDVLEWGTVASAFAVRFDNQAVAFLNRCAHVPSEMDWQPGEFWDQDKRFIICSVHGALYEPSDGLCLSGPCAGKNLISIALQERDGKVYWYPTEQFQPVF